MTGTDMNLNISYQDTQYLSELYAKLGEFQYELANIDIMTLPMRVGIIIVIILGLLVIGAGLLALVEIDEFGHSRGFITLRMFMIGLVIFVIILVATCWGANEFMLMYMEHDLLRDIQSTEMAIESIKMKYGLL